MATILIVDDDPAARELLATVLGYAGHVVHPAGDGAEALTLIREIDPPDLVIADLLMPTMDGFEFVRRLRELPAFRRTPVVFFTASYLETEARHLAHACGVAHILTKPAEPEAIFKLVADVLGESHPVVVAPPIEEFRRAHVSVLTAKLSQKAAEAVPRLEAMTELSLQLASERDPQRLLASFCAAARKIVGAKYATVGVYDQADHCVRYEYASGMSLEVTARLTSPPRSGPVLENVLSERWASRLGSLPGAPAVVGLPPEHPPVHSFLGAPITSPERTYGWLCLVDKIGAAEFSEEDEGLTRILASQVGRIYENGSLYREVQRTVARLKAEIVERESAEARIRELNASLERRVRERTAELENANAELEAFSFSVSHDLRSPLTAILGSADLVLRFYGQDLPAAVLENLQSVRDGARRMNQLIDDLLNLSRLTRHEVNRAPVDLSHVATEILHELKRTVPARHVGCHVEPGLVVWADPNLVRIALENLLRNAWKFTARQPAAVIEVGRQSNGTGQLFFVRDNGAGFSMQHAQRLFAPFQRLHHQEDFPGTGIGLAIVQRIMRRHGGDIWAAGEVDLGATFTFDLGAAAHGGAPASLKS